MQFVEPIRSRDSEISLLSPIGHGFCAPPARTIKSGVKGWRLRASQAFLVAGNLLGLRRSFAMLAIESNFGRIGFLATAAAVLLASDRSNADEGGVSFWLPGQYASLAATPQVPGWAMGVVYLHSNVAASGSVAAARQITVGRIPANVNV